jgi:hypothetical protein
MFARAAKSWEIDRARVATPVVPANSNNNHIDPPNAGVARGFGKRVLVRHWRVSPLTGKLECHWEIDNIERSSPSAGRSGRDQPRLYGRNRP